MTTDTNSSDDRVESTISRHAGTGVAGFIVGGGYRGKRDDQNKAVEELAERLSEAFPEYHVQIRFNTDQLSGGAWLVDTNENMQVGVGAELCAPDWYEEHRELAVWGDGEEDLADLPPLKHVDADELNLRYTVKIEAPAVAEEKCNRLTDRNDRKSFMKKQFHTVDAAWGYFEHVIERDQVNPPGDIDEN